MAPFRFLLLLLFFSHKNTPFYHPFILCTVFSNPVLRKVEKEDGE